MERGEGRRGDEESGEERQEGARYEASPGEADEGDRDGARHSCEQHARPRRLEDAGNARRHGEPTEVHAGDGETGTLRAQALESLERGGRRQGARLEAVLDAGDAGRLVEAQGALDRLERRRGAVAEAERDTVRGGVDLRTGQADRAGCAHDVLGGLVGAGAAGHVRGREVDEQLTRLGVSEGVGARSHRTMVRGPSRAEPPLAFVVTFVAVGDVAPSPTAANVTS